MENMKPVAWMLRGKQTGYREYFDHEPEMHEPQFDVIPLYALPGDIERDAARLDWLERHEFDAWGLPQLSHYSVGLKSKPPEADWCCMGETLRDAIDAAMTERAAIDAALAKP